MRFISRFGILICGGRWREGGRRVVIATPNQGKEIALTTGGSGGQGGGGDPAARATVRVWTGGSDSDIQTFQDFVDACNRDENGRPGGFGARRNRPRNVVAPGARRAIAPTRQGVALPARGRSRPHVAHQRIGESVGLFIPFRSPWSGGGRLGGGTEAGGGRLGRLRWIDPCAGPSRRSGRRWGASRSIPAGRDAGPTSFGDPLGSARRVL